MCGSESRAYRYLGSFHLFFIVFQPVSVNRYRFRFQEIFSNPLKFRKFMKSIDLRLHQKTECANDTEVVYAVYLKNALRAARVVPPRLLKRGLRDSPEKSPLNRYCDAV